MNDEAQPIEFHPGYFSQFGAAGMSPYDSYNSRGNNDQHPCQRPASPLIYSKGSRYSHHDDRCNATKEKP